MGLKIEYMSTADLKPYANNAKIHTAEQIEQIKKSIEQFGMNDPIAIWKNNEIIEGHGRLIACSELGIEQVPVIRLDQLTDEERKAYMLVHNQLTMNTGFDIDVLNMELEDINIDMGQYGFSLQEEMGEDEESKYTTKVKLPQYEVKGDDYSLDQLVETSKLDELLDEIEMSGVNEEEKEFLKICAYRHAVIDFEKCAEYYAKAEPEMQRLMENNALVFIDVNDAIANGFAELSNTLQDQLEREYFG